MTVFYILRHGESEWNADEDRYCGKSDIILSAEGKRQAEQAAKYLQSIPFAAIYSSPQQRALETVRPIAERQGLPVIIDERLREIDFGRWEGLNRKEIQQNFPDSWKKWNENPGEFSAGETGENADEVYERANNFYMEKMREHEGDTVLVLGHNTLNRLFIAGSLSIPFHKYRSLAQSNTGVSIVELTPGYLKWLQLNGTEHLTSL
ncbi:histidine phosphatase family protein [Paenibacillus sp. GCM10027626]|uniref:histidine phosphatase family protein n=1 Tax=Paenibacillus sp. GCM10027626 TaxID=3273411 RepID=UPI0036459F29